MKSSIKMSILPLLICLSFNGKALAASPVPLSCNESNYESYIWSFEKTQELIAETGKGCNLKGAKLRWIDLTDTDLRKAELRGAYLTRAYFRGVEIIRAEIIGANLTEANLTEAKYDDETIFPEGFDPVEFGMKKASEGDSGDN